MLISSKERQIHSGIKTNMTDLKIIQLDIVQIFKISIDMV